MGSIDRDSSAWSSNLLDSYINTIETFSKYDNALVYNLGNEVVVSPKGTAAAAFIKAAARDTRTYLCVRVSHSTMHFDDSLFLCRNSKPSPVLVKYAAIDGDGSWVTPLANYLSCDPSGSNSGSTAIDI